MKTLVRRIISILVLILALLGTQPQASLAQTDPVKDMLTRINTARLSQGLPPYALNSALVNAAERHSQDMASTGTVDHTGSDQSSYRQRILDAGYGRWTFGPMVNESIYGGTGGAESAYDWWMGLDTQRGQILSTRYREVGIAAITGANGWTYWTLTVGAQPDVLPAFVNDGQAEVENPDVLITLTNENAVPAGEGTTTMGQALQVRLANNDQFTGATWQPWQERIPFQLLPESEQRVYVQYRDAQGRTATAWATVILTNVPPTASPSPTPSETPTPEATETPLPASTPTAGPTAIPTSQLLAQTFTPTVLPAISPTTALVKTRAATVPPVTTRPPRPRPSPRVLITPTGSLISLNDSAAPPGLIPAWLVLQTIAIALVIAALVRKSQH